MSRFARIGEEAIRRQSELTGEEFRLYCLIVFHTWTESGICSKNLQQLSDIYGLTYNHATERYKTLRKEFSKNLKDKEKERRERERIRKMESPWCENTPQGIRPLVGIKTPKSGVGTDKGNSENWSAKLQKTELPTPKSGVNTGEELQKAELHIRNIEFFKDKPLIDSGSRKETAAAAVETKDQKSIFSLEECLRYAEFCVRRGDPIKSVEALARYAYQSGADDAFIEAAIYPATVIVESPPPTVFVEPRTAALEILLDLVRDGVDIENQKQFYAPEDWAILMEEICNIRA